MEWIKEAAPYIVSAIVAAWQVHVWRKAREDKRKELDSTQSGAFRQAQLTEDGKFRSDLLNRITTLEAGISGLQLKIAEYAAKEAQLTIENERLKHQLTELKEEMRDFKIDHKALIKELQAKNDEILKLRHEVDKLNAILRKHNINLEN